MKSDMVTLRSGTTMPYARYKAIINSLQELINDDNKTESWVAVQELRWLAEHKKSFTHPKIRKILYSAGLITWGGRVPSDIAQVVSLMWTIKHGKLEFTHPLLESIEMPESASEVDELILEKSEGLQGLELGFYVARKKIAAQKIVNFCHLVPQGQALWDAYILRAKPRWRLQDGRYSFADFIEEILGKVSNFEVASKPAA